jgi:phosphatidate phosphatase APP1
MVKKFVHKKVFIKIYTGYGHTKDLIIFGHVFKKKIATRKRFTNNYLANIIYLLKIFFVKPISNINVQLIWRNQTFHNTTAKDGFFKFEWQSSDEVAAGWHTVTINCINEEGKIIGTAEGDFFVPHSTQFAFISDIDDTVLISYSAKIGKRLRVLFTKNPRTRRPFAEVVKHYELLAAAHTTPQVPNPFFYVSSSEWNLYDYLSDFFKFNGLPKGTFLLNQVKRWFELWKTGKTKHEGKMLRIVRILNTFPKQKFILLGDNSQSDPAIYTAIANKFPGKIFAIYINNVLPKNEMTTRQLLDNMKNSGTFTCFHTNNSEAIEYSKAIGLIS